MAFVTSRNFTLPDTPDGLTNGLWFNMWAKKLWSYNELEPGHTLYWYESPSRCIVWRSKVMEVIRSRTSGKTKSKRNFNSRMSKLLNPTLSMHQSRASAFPTK